MEGFYSFIRFFASVSLVIGAVECFAGFKIMKAMMMIWSFFIGAMLGVILGVAADSTVLGFLMVIVFGVLLAALSFQFYSVGIFILTVFLTAIAIYMIFENIWLSLLISVGTGVLAMFLVKPVVIVTTAVSGAGMIIFSAYLLLLKDLNPSPVVTGILWIPIALTGMLVQVVTTGKMKDKIFRIEQPLRSQNPSRTFSERKYPGMQRIYRNFCIQCGSGLTEDKKKCLSCGYHYDD